MQHYTNIQLKAFAGLRFLIPRNTLKDAILESHRKKYVQ